MFAFQCPGSLLQIHFIAAVPAKEKPRKNVNFINLCRAVFGGNPFLCKLKGFFINQRFVCVGEKVTLFLRVLLRLFRFVRYLIALACNGMPQILFTRQNVIERLIRPVVNTIRVWAGVPVASCAPVLQSATVNTSCSRSQFWISQIRSPRTYIAKICFTMCAVSGSGNR